MPHGVTQTPAEALATVQGLRRLALVESRFSRPAVDHAARHVRPRHRGANGPGAEHGRPGRRDRGRQRPAARRDPPATTPTTTACRTTWEEQHGLNPNSPAGNPDWILDYDNDGYVNVEEYINEIAEWPAPYDIVFTGGTNARYEQITNWSITRPSPGEADTTTHWQPSRFDVAVINSGTVTVDSVGQHAGTIRLATAAGNNATLNITGGWLKVEDAAVGPGNGEVVIGAHPSATATLNLSGGKLTAKTLSKGAGGSFNFTGGVLSAETINFDLVNNGGTLAPGESPGSTDHQRRLHDEQRRAGNRAALHRSYDTVSVARRRYARRRSDRQAAEWLSYRSDRIHSPSSPATRSGIVRQFGPGSRVDIDGADGSFPGDRSAAIR